MNSIDLIEMIGNLSRSLFPVQHLLSGLSYLLGLTFFVTSLMKFKKLGESRNSNERAFVALAYFIGASALFFLPSAIEVLSNTTFGGAGNILQYTQYNPYDVKNSMDLLIRTAGIIWFIRGCILLTHASEPGVQHGPKGLTFLFAGILAINFDNTVEFLNWLLGLITTFTLSVKTNQGY